MVEDEIMELLWQNGQVVMQSQRSVKRSSASGLSDEMIPANRGEVPDPSSHQQQQSLFMQEDEMASWLLNDTPYDFCSDLLYSSASPCVNAAATTSTGTATTTATTTNVTAAASAIRAPHVLDQWKSVPAPRPPILPSREMENFGQLSRLSRRREDESGRSHSNVAVNELTVVDSSDTPAGRLQSRVSEAVHCEASRWTVEGGAPAEPATTPGCIAAGRETAACEATVTSSPGGSSASAEPTSQKPPPLPPPDDRKRKATEADDADCRREDVDIESVDAKKHMRGSTSTKRSRAAEVHNLSERRRRDRINEKMRALQELIPHCNKADKASMLDEAIDYLKSLQLQVQMMSMGCSMVPMMFPGVPQYMAHMGMGIGMGMGMNRPMMPFPNVLAGSPLLVPGSTAHLSPRLPMPTFHMQHADPSRGGVATSQQSGPMQSCLMMQNSRQHQIPNFVDPYQQYLGLHHLQMQPQQNQNQATQHGTSKPRNSKGAENLQIPKTG